MRNTYRPELACARILLSALLVAGMTWCGAACRTAAQSSVPPKSRVDSPTLAAWRGGESSTGARFEFGAVNLMDSPQLAHTFLLRNDSKSPLTLERFEPSCHCTSAELVPDVELPITLAPGAQAQVRVTVVAEPYMTGPLDKFVSVFAQNHPDPIATLTISATLHPLIVFDPLALDFGAVPAGQSHTVTLTATLDPRLVTGDAPPKLISSDSLLQVGPPVIVTTTSPGTRAFAYQVTLPSDDWLGPLSAQLHFAPSDPAVSGLSLADGPNILVTGEVTGAAAVQPSSLAFGVVHQGKPTILPVILTGTTKDALRDAQLTAEGSGVSARWDTAKGTTRTFKVTLDAVTLGLMQGQATVHLSNGQRLRIPITGYVSNAH